jgi:Leucine-rich repeat (LRR) protein
MELYIGNNLMDELKEVLNLKLLPKLIILDLSGNSLCKEGNYRVYCIFHLRKLKVLDGLQIESQELLEAKDMFAGRLTEEILESRLNGRSMANVRDLDLSNSKLRDFDDMFDESLFPNLRELNLSHNSLVTLRGFGFCPKLKIL